MPAVRRTAANSCASCRDFAPRLATAIRHRESSPAPVHRPGVRRLHAKKCRDRRLGQWSRCMPLCTSPTQEATASANDRDHQNTRCSVNSASATGNVRPKLVRTSGWTSPRMPMGLPSTVKAAARPSTNVGCVDRRVLGCPAELAEQGIDHAAGGGVAALAADLDERHAAFFGGAGFGRRRRVRRRCRFRTAAAASGGGDFRGALRTGRP